MDEEDEELFGAKGRNALYKLVELEADPPGETLMKPLVQFAESLEQDEDDYSDEVCVWVCLFVLWLLLRLGWDGGNSLEIRGCLC